MKPVLLDNDNIVYVKKGGLEYIQFKNFKKYDGIIEHCFTTRRGGVSTGECSSLNLGFNKNDSRENVEENYRRVCNALNIDLKNLVFSNQIHDNKIKAVDEKDRGKGITRKSDITGYDGLVTNSREVALVTFYADCVPVYYFDPRKKVIASVHSGWRGTVKEIAKEALILMKDTYGCNIEDIEIAIGPCIGRCCFEVGDEVYGEFAKLLQWSSAYCFKGAENKWHIDLAGIIAQTLVNTGARSDKICNGAVCTKCNNDIFFSYRGDMGKTGSLAAIIQLS